MNQEDYNQRSPYQTPSDQHAAPGQQGPVDSFAMPGMQETLPNSTGVLVMGILSIVCCFCYGLPRLILAIIAMVLASQSKKLLEANPGRYSIASVKNMKAGHVCAIIGLILSILFVLFVIIYFIAIGTLITSPDFWQNMSQMAGE